jgi:O-antigen/teichoic acid export membrane protein
VRTLDKPSLFGRLGRLKVLAQRLGWVVGDQILFSLTNALLSIIIARAVDAEHFGAFSIAFAIYSFYIGFQRALITTAFTMRWADAEHSELRKATSSCVGSAAALGTIVGAGVAVIACFVTGTTSGVLFALAISLPGLAIQDAWRAVFVADGRARYSATNDLLCAVLQIGGTVLLVESGHKGVAAITLVWGLSTTVGGAWGCVQARVAPKFRGSTSWLKSSMYIWRYLVPEYVGVNGAYQLAVLSVGIIGSASDIGALRSAAVLLGPVNIISTGLQTFAIPEIVRRKGRPPEFYRRIAYAVSGAHILVPAVWGGLLLLLPYSAGHALLGDSWVTGRSVLPASILGLAAIGATVGVGVLLNAFQEARQLLRLSFLLPPLHIIFGVSGAAIDGVQGAALGFGLAACVIVPFWWLKLPPFLAARAVDSTRLTTAAPKQMSADDVIRESAAEDTVAELVAGHLPLSDGQLPTRMGTPRKHRAK